MLCGCCTEAKRHPGEEREEVRTAGVCVHREGSIAKSPKADQWVGGGVENGSYPQAEKNPIISFCCGPPESLLQSSLSFLHSEARWPARVSQLWPCGDQAAPPFGAKAVDVFVGTKVTFDPEEAAFISGHMRPSLLCCPKDVSKPPWLVPAQELPPKPPSNFS